jgi:hypothetical protein
MFGWQVDIEAYGGPLWDYKRQRDASTKSFKEYSAQVRLRGAEVMKAFEAAYPGVTIILTEGYTLPYRDAWPSPYKPGPDGFTANSADAGKLKQHFWGPGKNVPEPYWQAIAKAHESIARHR